MKSVQRACHTVQGDLVQKGCTDGKHLSWGLQRVTYSNPNT